MSSSTGQAVALSYAKALVALGKMDKELLESLSVLEQLLRPFMEGFFMHPQVPSRAKAQVLAKALGVGQVPEVTRNFLQLLALRGRLGILPLVIKGAKGLVAQQEGRAYAVVKSAEALPQEQMQELKQIAQKLAGKELNLHNVPEPGVLGGVSLELEGRTYNDTLLLHLENLQSQLENPGVLLWN